MRRAELHILPALGDVRVTDLRTRDLNKWKAELVATPARYRPNALGMSKERESDPRQRKATANKVITVLKAALNYAMTEDEELSDAAWCKERFKQFEEVDEAKIEFLTEDEASRLINAADEASGFRDLVRAALITGCRYGELCRLIVSDFAVVRGVGKLAITKSKSGKARSIDLFDDGLEFFRRLTIGKNANDLLLPHRRLGRAWAKSDQNRPMADAVEAAKIGRPISFHVLRHTWASNAVMNGMPLMVVAHVLGHASTLMTQKHYAHLAPSHVSDTIRQFAPRYDGVKELRSNVRAMRNERKIRARS